MVAKTPNRATRAEVLRVALLPDLLPIGDAQAQEFAAGSECVEPIGVHRGRALREPPHARVFLDGVVHTGGPQFFAGPRIEREDKLAALTVANGENATARDGDGMDTQTDASGAPNERRTIVGPLFEQAGFARGVRTVRASPLRPIG